VLSPFLAYLTFHSARFLFACTVQFLQNILQIYSPPYSIVVESLLTPKQQPPFPSKHPPIHRHFQLISFSSTPFLAAVHSLCSLRYSLFLRNGIFSHPLHSLISSIFRHSHNRSASNLDMKPSIIPLGIAVKLLRLQLTPAIGYLHVKLLLH